MEEEWRGIEGRTFVVGNHIANVVPSAVVSLAHAHRVVREVDVAVVAEDCHEKRLAMSFLCYPVAREKLEGNAYTLAS
jgi:hypothetical protein